MSEKLFKSIDFGCENFEFKLSSNFDSDGVVVIRGVWSMAECITFADEIIMDFHKLGTGIDKDNLLATWIKPNIPLETKTGLLKTIVGNFKTSWKIRSDQKVRKIFETLYSKSRGKKVTEFIVSGDALNFNLVGETGPFHGKRRDWAHIDQTHKDLDCIQGQAVLTNTTACLVASPRSHLVFDKIIDTLGIAEENNFHKFTDAEIKIIKKIMQEELDQPITNLWQQPILAEAGSFIVWNSKTIHSARLQTKSQLPTKLEPHHGRRIVIYVSYRPKEDFTKEEIERRIDAYENNKVTTHWASQICELRPGNPKFHDKKNEEMEKLLDNPILVYDKIGKPVLTDEQRKLIGL